jgi:transcription elongation factor Elf1
VPAVATQPDDNFTCPRCGAHYKLVQVSAAGRRAAQPVVCLDCRHPFDALAQNGQIVKYFLVRHAQPHRD